MVCRKKTISKKASAACKPDRLKVKEAKASYPKKITARWNRRSK